MASAIYKNGSWYVVYSQAKPVKCHNRATAMYLAKQANRVQA